MKDRLASYREVLDHIVRPADPSDRDDANSVEIRDYMALFLRDACREYAAYGASTDVESRIADGYAGYIEHCVYDFEDKWVTLYAHTDEAIYVVRDACDAYDDGHTAKLPADVSDQLAELTA